MWIWTGRSQALTISDKIVFYVWHSNKTSRGPCGYCHSLAPFCATVILPPFLSLHPSFLSNLGCRKTFVRVHEACYFPQTRKVCYDYV